MTDDEPAPPQQARPEAPSPAVRAQAAKALLAIDRKLGRPSDPRVVELAKRARH